MKGFADIADLSEDDRITAIGNRAMTGEVVGFITDDEPGKAERYIRKLAKRFPKVVILDQKPGPVARTTLVRCTLAGGERA